MQKQEFINFVKERALVDSDDDALRLVRATFQTLVAHMAGNAPAKLAAQLPEGIAELMTELENSNTPLGEKFGVEEFVRRVSERAGGGETSEAALQASAVLSVLRDAVSNEEFDKVRGTFPAEYNALFEQGNSEAMSTRY